MNGDRMIIAKGECPDPTAVPWHSPELDSGEKRTGVSHKRSEERSTSTTRIKVHGESLKRKTSSY